MKKVYAVEVLPATDRKTGYLKGDLLMKSDSVEGNNHLKIATYGMPSSLWSPYYMYISDNSAVIAEGDWIIWPEYNLVKKMSADDIYRKSQAHHLYKKIVSANDPKCEGIPQIHTEDLQKWIDNGAKDTIELEMEWINLKMAIVQGLNIDPIRAMFMHESQLPPVINADAILKLKDNYIIPVWEDGLGSDNSDNYTEEDLKNCWNAAAQFYKGAGGGKCYNDWVAEYKKSKGL